MEEHTHIPNGKNGKGWHKDFGLETAGLFVAEFASMAVSVGSFTFLGEVAPHLMQDVSKAIGKVCVEPFLDNIEKGLQKTCKLKDCQPDFTKSREERAQQYAQYLTLFGISLIAGIATEIGVRKLANNWLGINGATSNGHTGWRKFVIPNKRDLTIAAIDRGTQLGAIIAVNSIGAKKADVAIDGVKSFLQNTFGWSEERAKKASEMLVVYEAPNWIGFGAATSFLGHDHYTHKK